MGQDSKSERAVPSPAEIELRRYEARLGLWKVVLGTFIIGLAGVLIPGFINFYNARFENRRKQAELSFSQQTAHQQYIKDFFTTAINQDIELRIRFAEYFANLSGKPQDELWKQYLEELRKLRDTNRTKINDLEQTLVDFKKLSPDKIDNAEFDRVNRQLAWANKELGYSPTERSAVIALSDSSPLGKKIRLYKETTELVQRLAVGPSIPGDVDRFWTLYRRDLIGVESSEFARTMIAIGKLIKPQEATNAQPELKPLADDLLLVSRRELSDTSQNVAQPQQQSQQEPQPQHQQQQQQQQQQ